MEESRDNNIYLLAVTLNDNFDQQQWHKIRSQPAQKFHAKQQIILTKLLEQKKLFDKYFENFYSNHVKLLNWSILCPEKREEISRYIYKELVHKGSNFFYKQIKQIFEKKNKNKINNQRQGVDSKEVKNMEEQVYQYFFDMIVSNKNKKMKQNVIGVVGVGNRTKRGENDVSQAGMRNWVGKKQPNAIDGHQFYIRTFNACNGWKYIFYNYEKHMKGLRQKRKYNEKIRQSQVRNSICYENRPQLGLLDYQHPQVKKQESKVYNLNSILNNSKLNNISTFKQLAKNSLKDRICFRNHLGKPITYRACRV